MTVGGGGSVANKRCVEPQKVCVVKHEEMFETAKAHRDDRGANAMLVRR